jgi:carboxyl-terminal processing protease
VAATSIVFISNKEEGDKSIEKSSFDVIDEAFAIIKEQGVYPVEGELLIEGALRGMTEVIGDPYSTYLSEEEAAAHEESLAGERIGIGAEITRSNGKFVIVAPVKSSPADKAGLRPYDELIRIDGENLDGSSTLKDVVQKIRGKKGTAVTLTIYRPELNKHLEISIIRDVIPVTTVNSEIIEEKERKVGYISITTFGSETAKEWAIATENLIGDGVEAIVIDVRGNPGGYLHSVGTILSSLLQEDTIYAYLQDANGALTPLLADQDEKLKFNSQLKKVPLVLLQDKGSASASEMLSGALKDLRRASIAGTESFGKGTVQDTQDLSNGGKVKLSTAKWLTPKEKWIHGKGVEADLKIAQDGLFEEHIRLVSAEYNEGDFAEDVAYSQKLLIGLGYDAGREDGYFDEATTKAVKEFQVYSKVTESGKMDRQFFTALQKEIETYRKNQENDVQLQMGLDYLLHLLKE